MVMARGGMVPLFLRGSSPAPTLCPAASVAAWLPPSFPKPERHHSLALPTLCSLHATWERALAFRGLETKWVVAVSQARRRGLAAPAAVRSLVAISPWERSHRFRAGRWPP